MKPTVEDFKDIASNSMNDTLTPNAVGHITGSSLKINTEDTEQGIFLIASDGTTIQVSTLIRNKPSEVIFMIPALASGTYRLEIRNKPKTKELRIGQLNGDLVVS